MRALVTGYWEVSLDWRLLMGAAIAIPLIIIVLITLGYALWNSVRRRSRNGDRRQVDATPRLG